MLFRDIQQCSSEQILKWSLSDYASDRDYAVNTLASYFGNEYKTEDLSQINGGNDMYSYDWRKTTDENWDVYLAVADEHYDNEGGKHSIHAIRELDSLFFAQLKK